MQSASCLLIAINVPLNENANGSLNADEFINSISWPGVKPISNNLLKDGCVLSISDIIPFSPKFNLEAVFILFANYLDLVYIKLYYTIVTIKIFL